MPQFSYDHIHLVSADPNKAAKWYEQAFGAKIKETGKYPDGGDRVELSLSGTRLLIRSPRGATQSAEDSPHSRRGLEHFGLKVDDMRAAVAAIKSKGIKFQEEPRISLPSGNTVAFLMGPDNVLIELVQAK